MKRIKVAVGIIFNEQGKVLVGQRTVRDQYFQKWEFPGGKLESNESVSEALQRELSEELAIEVKESQPLMTLEHDYPDRKVQLLVRTVTSYTGTPHGAENQQLKWVATDDLEDLDFLTGNKAIIEAVQTLTETRA